MVQPFHFHFLIVNSTWQDRYDIVCHVVLTILFARFCENLKSPILLQRKKQFYNLKSLHNYLRDPSSLKDSKYCI